MEKEVEASGWTGSGQDCCERNSKMKTLILGLGNPILTDDWAGITIAQKIKEWYPHLQVIETSEAGLSLLDHLVGYDKLIIIDSIRTEKGKPGDFYRLKLEDLKSTVDLSSFHGMDIATAFEIGKGLGYKMPRYVSIYAVETKNNTTFGEGCTEGVKKRIPFIAQEIMTEEKV